MNDIVMTGDNLEWQESYDFKKDNNFTKTRIREGITTKISRTFSMEKKDVTYFELTYITTSPIIGSCDGEKKEVLFLTNEGLLKNTWNHCDGPGLIYEKAE